MHVVCGRAPCVKLFVILVMLRILCAYMSVAHYKIHPRGIDQLTTAPHQMSVIEYVCVWDCVSKSMCTPTNKSDRNACWLITAKTINITNWWSTTFSQVATDGTLQLEIGIGIRGMKSSQHNHSERNTVT